MHVSLDSALGRQRRLNSVGESVLQIAPSAAAAYSLRSLTGGDPKVVRVRRGSDNHEQDFTASEVSSGALTSFVNAQVVAPLDIQALTATGRDGDFLIAKAAYSLRSLGTRQATLAATGDTVARADGKFVAQVRRSSDDAVKSFTADEITDGTLLAFVNEIQTLGTVTNSSGNNGFTLTNTSSTGFTATTDTATGVCGWPYTAKSGDKIAVSFDAVIRSGTPQFIPRKATALSGSNLVDVVSDSALAVNSTGSYSFEFAYDSDEAGSLTFSEGDDNADFDISNFQVTVFKGAGLVKTWYDQSVSDQAGAATGNHAVQATAANQPKIVNAGTLLNELDFDGTDDVLATSESSTFSQPLSLFHVFNSSESVPSDYQINAGGSSMLTGSDGSIYYFAGSLLNSTIDFPTSGDTLHSVLFNGASSTVHADGTSVASGDIGSGTFSKTFAIGGRTNDSQFSDMSFKEIIIYDTDQSDNRTAIEANIGEVYSIDLPSGVDPGFDQVDGFVETWYDQSGNSRDSINTTAAQQPMIVEAGVFQDGLKFTHTDTTNGKRLFVPLTAANLGIFTFVYVGKVTESDTSFNNLLGGTRGVQSYAAGTAGISIKSSDGTIAFMNEQDATTRVKSDSSTTTTLNEDFVAFATYEDAEAGPELTLQVDAGNQTFSFGSPYVTTSTKDIGIMNATGPTTSGYRTQESPTGICREVLVYSSHQGDNRAALVDNINSQYNLF